MSRPGNGTLSAGMKVINSELAIAPVLWGVLFGEETGQFVYVFRPAQSHACGTRHLNVDGWHGGASEHMIVVRS